MPNSNAMLIVSVATNSSPATQVEHEGSGGGAVKVASQLKSGSVMDILGGKSSAPPSSGLKVASELKTGSVMDILGGSQKKSGMSFMSEEYFNGVLFLLESLERCES